MDLTPLADLSNRYGGNPNYVLAGGGNTSVKDNGILYVKASGTKLATIREEGFVPVSVELLRKTLQTPYPPSDKEREAAFLADVQAARVLPGENRRPSVEALLHALFPQKYVLHLHPTAINALTCSLRGRDAAQELYGDAVCWIDQCRPGYILGRTCKLAMDDYFEKTGRVCSVILLQNHGSFVAADSPEELDSLMEFLLKPLEARIPTYSDQHFGSANEALAQTLLNASGMREFLFCGTEDAVAYTASRQAAEKLLKPFTPDHIVVCGAFPTYTSADDAQTVPAGARVVLVENVGWFALGATSSQAQNVAALFSDAIKIAEGAAAFGGPSHMSDDMIDFIVHWEAESYRSKKL